MSGIDTIAKLTMKEIEKMTKKQLVEELNKRVPTANEQLKTLIDKDLYSYSNTIQRYHEQRLNMDFIGRVEETPDYSSGDFMKTTSAKFLSGSSHYTKTQLQLRLAAVDNFLHDENVTENKIKTHQERLAAKLYNLDADEKPTQQQIEDTKIIWRIWRNLGMSRDRFAESDAVLTEIAFQVAQYGSLNAETRLERVRQVSHALQFTQEDLVETLSSHLTDMLLEDDDVDWNGG